MTEAKVKSSIPSTKSLLLRPIGYLSLALLWVAILLVGVALLAAIPIATSHPWSEAPGIVKNTPQNFFGFIPIVIVAVVVPAALAVAFFIPAAALPQIVLSITYAFRALNPKYFNEKLSGTVMNEDSVGLAGRAAISLLPLRRSKFTMFWYTFSFWAFTFNLPTYKGYIGLTVTYLSILIIFLWPVTNIIALIIWSLVALAGLIFGIRWCVKGYKQISSQLV